jgi:hypothetical protein
MDNRKCGPTCGFDVHSSKQARSQNISLGGGGGTDPRLYIIYFYFKFRIIKIMA